MGVRWLYSLHDLINIESEFRLTQLSQFSVPDVPAVDLRIERDHGRMSGSVRIDQYDWNEETQTLVADFAPFVRASLCIDDDIVVLTMTPLYARLSNFDRLLQWAIDYLLRRQNALVLYAAGVTITDGTGLMLVGPPGIGKSTTALRLARETGGALVGDDQVLVRDGQLYSYEPTSHLHRNSPLVKQLGDSEDRPPSPISTLVQYTNPVDRSILSRALGQLLARLVRLKPRVEFQTSDIAPVTETASLEACLLLYPGDGPPTIQSASRAVTADRISLLNDWRYQRTDIFSTVARYLTGDAALEGQPSSNPRTPEAIRAALGDCDCYEVRAPAGKQASVIKDRFDN
jgi:hypothetical protein